MATRFASHLLTGSHASRPAATAVPEGSLYSCTTHALIYQSDGATWSTYATLGSTETLPGTIVDAKGDLVSATAADTPARLAVGSNAQVLTADSAEATGLKWATPSAGAAGAVTLLHTLTLGSAGTFDQASISGAYNDLICVLIGRGVNASTGDTVKWNLNNDTGANYNMQQSRANATSATIAGTASQASFHEGGRIPASTAIANHFGVVELTIFGYASTTWSKSCMWQAYSNINAAASATAQNREISGGFWNSTAAVTRIQAQATTSANLVTGSQLRIYGRL